MSTSEKDEKTTEQSELWADVVDATAPTPTGDGPAALTVEGLAAIVSGLADLAVGLDLAAEAARTTAERLAALTSGGVGDPSPLDVELGFPLTVVAADPAPPVEVNYSDGNPLTAGGLKARQKAERRANDRGFDLKHFAEMVLSIRRRNLSVTQEQFGRIVGVQSGGAVGNWERGTAFPLDGTLRHMMDLFELTHGIPQEDWRRMRDGSDVEETDD